MVKVSVAPSEEENYDAEEIQVDRHTSNKKGQPHQEQKSSKVKRLVMIWMPTILLSSILAVTIYYIICFAKSVDNDNDRSGLDDESWRNDCGESYWVTLKIETNMSFPCVPTDNGSSFCASGWSSTSWKINENDRGRYATYGGSWFDKALRIDFVDHYNDTLNVRVDFNNDMKMDTILESARILDTTEYKCDTPTSSAQLLTVPIGGASDSVALGICHATRLPSDENSSLEPTEFDVFFHGKVLVEKA